MLNSPSRYVAMTDSRFQITQNQRHPRKSQIVAKNLCPIQWAHHQIHSGVDFRRKVAMPIFIGDHPGRLRLSRQVGNNQNLVYVYLGVALTMKSSLRSLKIF